MQRLELTFRRTFVTPFKSHLVMDDHHIEYNDKTLSFNEITELISGILLIRMNGIPTSQLYQVSLKTADPKRKIVITLHAPGFFKLYKKKEEIYLNIVNMLWPIKKRLVNDAISRLNRKETIELAGVKLNHEGIWIKHGIFKKETTFVPWKDSGKTVGYGALILTDITKKKVKQTIQFLRVANAVVLDVLLRHLWENGKVLKLAHGEKVGLLA